MTKLNFHAIQKDIESLFNKYDENGTNSIDYKLFSYCICGFLNFGSISNEKSCIILQKIRKQLIKQYSIDCIPKLKQSFLNILSNNTQNYGNNNADCIDIDASNTYLCYNDFYNGLCECNIHISTSECIYLFNDICNIEQIHDPLNAHNTGVDGASTAFHQDFSKTKNEYDYSYNNTNINLNRSDSNRNEFLNTNNTNPNSRSVRFDSTQTGTNNAYNTLSNTTNSNTNTAPGASVTISLLEILNIIRVSNNI